AGLVLAHQYLNQCTGSLQSSLAANTGIKFASGLSASDARAMAADMRTNPDFILDQPRLQFAAHIRNVTPHAVSIPIAFPRRPAMLGDEDFAALIVRNRERVSIEPDVTNGTAPSADADHSPAVPDEDISPEW